MNVVLASNDPKYNDPILGAQVTGGSWSTGMNFDAMCRAGAAGRITLIKAAAEMLGVPEGELRAREFARSSCQVEEEPDLSRRSCKSGKANKAWSPDELKAIKLKTPDQYTKIGQSLPQLDIPSKTNGTCKYGIDAFVPGMLYGKLAMPPVRYGATVKSVDDSEAKKVPGFVKAVVVDDKTATTSGWVVAVATSYEGAKKAAAALKIDWDKGPVCQRLRPVDHRRSHAGCRKKAPKASCSSRTAIPPRRWRRPPRSSRANTSPASTSMRRWSR